MSMTLASIESELRESGLPWHIESDQGKHIKIFVCDRVVGIWPRSKKNRRTRAILNIRAQVRRAVRAGLH